MNVTDPVGIPDPGGSTATVAQTCTGSPQTELAGVAVTVVVVEAAPTVTETLPVEVAKQGLSGV
ncbi:hypothetical protein [Streptomyces sioyaensis]|uniref:hypothetical protein n=1 Tax=Streptomyces sioyaensis TaxID=67364 RepID=UPI0036DFAFD0